MLAKKEWRVKDNVLVYRGEKIEIYSSSGCALLKLLPPFNQLWQLPWQLQSYIYIPDLLPNCTPYPFQLPSVSLSTLSTMVGKDYVILDWSSSQDNGPVRITTGKELELFSSLLNYTIEWQATSPVKIGFYSVETSLGDELYPLLDNDYTLQITKGSHGRFSITEYQQFYVAAKSLNGKDALLSLNVFVNAPEVITTTPELGITYLDIPGEDCDNSISLPLYKSKLDPLGVLVNVKLNPKFKDLYARIRSVYRSLGIPVPPLPPVTGRVLQEDPPILTYCPYQRINFETRIQFTALPNFVNYPSLRRGELLTSIFGGIYVGIDSRVAEQGVTVTYDVTIVPPPPSEAVIFVQGGSVCVVACTVRGVDVVPLTLTNQGGPQIGIQHNINITNPATLNLKGTLTVPYPTDNISMQLRAGRLDQNVPFYKLSNDERGLNNFVVFNRIDIVARDE